MLLLRKIFANKLRLIVAYVQFWNDALIYFQSPTKIGCWNLKTNPLYATLGQVWRRTFHWIYVSFHFKKIKTILKLVLLSKRRKKIFIYFLQTYRKKRPAEILKLQKRWRHIRYLRFKNINLGMEPLVI